MSVAWEFFLCCCSILHINSNYRSINRCRWSSSLLHHWTSSQQIHRRAGEQATTGLLVGSKFFPSGSSWCGDDLGPDVPEHTSLWKKRSPSVRSLYHNSFSLSWMGTLYFGIIYSQAMSAVDLALWDLLGKLRGEPVYAMLGGKTKVIYVCIYMYVCMYVCTLHALWLLGWKPSKKASSHLSTDYKIFCVTFSYTALAHDPFVIAAPSGVCLACWHNFTRKCVKNSVRLKDRPIAHVLLAFIYWRSRVLAS